jgi:hypothetical protein
LATKPKLPFTFDVLYFESTQMWCSDAESRRTLTAEQQRVCEDFVDSYAFAVPPEPQVHLVGKDGLYKGLGRPSDGIVVGPPPSDGVYRWDTDTETWNRVMGADVDGQFVMDDVDAVALVTPRPPSSDSWWRWDELEKDWKDVRTLQDLQREGVQILMEGIEDVRLGFLERRGSQDYIYILKAREAQAFKDAGSPDFVAGDWPFLKADMEVERFTNPTITADELADAILYQAAYSAAALLPSERIRRGAKKSIMAATSSDEIDLIIDLAVSEMGSLVR